MTGEITGVAVDNLTTWGEPFVRDGKLMRVGPVSRLFGILHYKFPHLLRNAGVYLWKIGGKSCIVQYLHEVPVPVPLAAPVVRVDERGVSVNEQGLKSWQVLPLKRLKFFWERGRRVLADLSDTGTGKTYVSLALARETGRPAFVVTVKNAVSQWVEAADAMQVVAHVTHYEALKTKRHPWVKWEVKNGQSWPGWTLQKNRAFVIFDEAQRCKSLDLTLNSKLLLMLAYQKIPGMLLSATIMTSPVHLRAAGYALGLHDNVNFGEWLSRHGCFASGRTWFFNNDPKVLRDIHEKIFNECAVRVRKSDLGDLFPATVIEPWLMEFDSAVAERYQSLSGKLREFRERSANFGTGAFVETQKARMEVEFIKVPGAVEMAADWVEEGMKVVLFFNFNEPANEAAKMLGCPKITGETKQKDREAVKKAFQADELPVIVCNVEAGGTALNLHGVAERGTIIMPTWKADTMRQVLGRTHRAGGSRSVQRILFAKGTVEEDICHNLRRKLNNLDTLNDGDTQGNLQWVNKAMP